LRSAESCIKLADWLRKSGTAQSAWTGLVVRCERQLRLVETRLAGVRPVGLTETGPENQPLIEWVADLRTQWNALKDRLPDGLPNRTTESGDATWDHLPFAEPFREGTPSLWGELAVRDATFEVVATDGPQWAGRIGTMWLVLAALIAVALMVGLSGTATRSEQVALLGVVGIVTFGWPVGAVFVGVVLLSLGLRVLSLVGWAMGWLFGRSREMVRGT